MGGTLPSLVALTVSTGPWQELQKYWFEPSVQITVGTELST